MAKILVRICFIKLFFLCFLGGSFISLLSMAAPQVAANSPEKSVDITIDAAEHIKKIIADQGNFIWLTIYVVGEEGIPPLDLKFAELPVHIDRLPPPYNQKSQLSISVSVANKGRPGLFAYTSTMVDLGRPKEIFLYQLAAGLSEGTCSHLEISSWAATLKITEQTRKFFDPGKKYYLSLVSKSHATVIKIWGQQELDISRAGTTKIRLNFPKQKIDCTRENLAPGIFEYQCSARESMQECNRKVFYGFALPQHFSVFNRRLITYLPYTGEEYDLQAVHYTESPRAFLSDIEYDLLATLKRANIIVPHALRAFLK